LLLASGVAAQAAEPARVVETRALSGQQLPAALGATHELRLSLYAFQGGRWTSSEMLPAALDAARLLAQCGVALAEAELRLLEAPRRFHFYSTPVSREYLMRAVTSRDNTRLSDAQCRRLRERGTANGLLAPKP
jgi:hypothetical protein